jgi:ASC-1-like (ASCH) protein
MNDIQFDFREVDKARFEEVRMGLKKIETRAGKEKYLSIQVGDEITLRCGDDFFSKKVVRKYHWATIEEMLSEIPLKDVMPDLDTIEQVRDRYDSYPGYAEVIKKLGILGYELA